MFLHIDYNSGEPILHQAVAEIKLLLVKGMIKPGDRLPSIREMSKDLRINPTTVSRVYGELAHQGVVTLRQGQGVFVSDGSSRLASEEVREGIRERARELLVEGLRNGLKINEIKEILEDEHAKIKGETR